MTAYRVTMAPDKTGWTPEELRLGSGWPGFRYTTTDAADAFERMESAAALGMVVGLEHVEEEQCSR